MKKTIVLHIGLPKTGTTALQKWCHGHRTELRNAGIDYPEAIESEVDPKHQFLVHELKSGDFHKLREVLRNSPCDRIFLSTEGISNQFLDFTEDQLAVFRGELSEHEVVVFVVSREWAGWVRSYYSQCVVNPPVPGYPYATRLSCEEFSQLERVRFLGNLPKARGILSAAFGAQEVVVSEHAGDWFSAWGNLVGYPLTGTMLERSNESLDARMIALVVEVNRASLSYQARSLLMAAIQRVNRSNNTILRSYSGVPSTAGDQVAALSCIEVLNTRRVITPAMAELLSSQLISKATSSRAV